MLIGWVIGIALILFLCAVIFSICYFLARYLHWLWRHYKAGTQPFPGVTPWRAFWIWRFTRPGSWGDIFSDHDRGHHHHDI